MAQGRQNSAHSEVGDEWGKILPRYPDGITEEERRRIEPSIRAAFMAFADGDFKPTVAGQAGDSATIRWAKAFWRSNWSLYACIASEAGAEDELDDEDPSPRIRDAREAWRERLRELTDRFLRVAWDADPDLYRPDRHEVLTGITYRMLRALTILIDHPGMWTSEHAASHIRGLVERQGSFSSG